MDAFQTFWDFCHAVEAGDYQAAADAARIYNEWRDRGGFPARDWEDDPVQRLDHERDRFGVSLGLGSDSRRLVDRWRPAAEQAKLLRQADAERCRDQAAEAMGEAQERNACRGDS
ncbi:MAG: hypothetical protein ACYTG2_19235 [Planctomycetota bacterium]|jgi:hypothetical protein